MSAQPMAIGRQIDVNGASLYVEERDQGKPLVLVQPGLASSAAYAAVAALLAKDYHVITFDTRGHGRSTNPDRQLTYELVADDTAALIEALGIEQPFVGGWSDGGEIALQCGLRHPGRAGALIAGATSLELGTEKARAGMRAFLQIGDDGVVDFDAFAAGPGQDVLPMMRQLHPGGEDQVRTIVQQSSSMWLSYGGLTREQVARIDVPTLVVVGDRDDFVPVEEGVRLMRRLPNAELAILPGAAHMRPIFEPDTFARVIVDFLQRH